MNEGNKKIVIATVGKSFRLKGEFKIFSYADPIESVFNLSPWLIKLSSNQITQLLTFNPDLLSHFKKTEEDFYQVKLEKGVVLGKNLIAQIEGISSPEALKVLTNSEIYVFRDTLEKLENGQYYWCDLIGLKAVNQKGQELGRVKKLLENINNSILEIQSDNQTQNPKPNQTILIPFLPVFIQKVDLKNQTILVDWEEDY